MMYPPSPMHPLAHLRMPVDANPNPLDVAFWDVCHGTIPVAKLWEFSRDWERSLWDVTGLVATRERTQRSVGFDVDNNQLLDASGGTELELLVYTIVRERAFRQHPFIPGLWMPFLTSIISVYARVCGYRGVTSSFADIFLTWYVAQVFSDTWFEGVHISPQLVDLTNRRLGRLQLFPHVSLPRREWSPWRWAVEDSWSALRTSLEDVLSYRLSINVAEMGSMASVSYWWRAYHLYLCSSYSSILDRVRFLAEHGAVQCYLLYVEVDPCNDDDNLCHVLMVHSVQPMWVSRADRPYPYEGFNDRDCLVGYCGDRTIESGVRVYSRTECHPVWFPAEDLQFRYTEVDGAYPSVESTMEAESRFRPYYNVDRSDVRTARVNVPRVLPIPPDLALMLLDVPNVDILRSGMSPLQLYSFLRMYVCFRMFIDADNIRVYEGYGPNRNRNVQSEMLTVWRAFDYLWDWLRAVVHNGERMVVPLESVITAEMTVVGAGRAILADWVFYVNQHLQRIFGSPPPMFHMHENVAGDIRFPSGSSRIWWTGAYDNVVSATLSLFDYVRFLFRG